MEAAGIIALVRATTSTCIQARNLCSIWKNAPRDVFHLRDELQTYQTFYESIQTSIVDFSVLSEIGLDMGEKSGGTEARKLQTVQRDALQGLLAKGLGVAKSIEVILIELIGKTMTSQETGDRSLGTEGLKAALTLSKKLLWLRRMDTVKGLRKMLRDTTNGITFCLTILNVQVTVIVAKGGEEQIGAIVERSESNMIRHFYESAESSRRAFEGSMTTSMLALAYDAIGSDSTVRQCAAVLSKLGGGRIASVGSAPAGLGQGVDAVKILSKNIDSHQPEVSRIIWGSYVPSALISGKLVPAPGALVVGEGLGELQEGIDRQKQGVSAQKVVVKL
ncbi:hypothetical protein V8F06_005149 [Rhypophila decipiens]